MRESKQNRRANDSALQVAFDWIHRTGWPTREADRAIAKRAYNQWLKGGNSGCAAAEQHDVEVLYGMLGKALSKFHPSDGVQYLQIILVLELVIRGRAAGVLKQHSRH